MATDYTVEQGDTLISIAHAHGLRDCMTIWGHEKNAGLRSLRANPQVIVAGDVIHIPDPEVVPFERDTGNLHTFTLKKLRAHFSVRLEDEAGEPFGGDKYELEVGGETFTGITGGDGWLSCEVSPDATEGELTLWKSDDPEDRFTWKVKIGHLDPVDEVSGVQATLANLGYDVGPVDGELNESTKSALEDFQLHMGFPEPTGELDEATRQMLKTQQPDEA